MVMAAHSGIFISYSHEDRFIAATIAQHLREIGYHPWIDFASIVGGEEWKRLIDQALTQSRACLVLLTPESAASVWVRHELDMARAQDCPIIPLLVRTCTLPSDLEALHYIDFRQNTDEAFKELQRALLSTLIQPPTRSELSSTSEPTPAPPPNPASPAPIFNRSAPIDRTLTSPFNEKTVTAYIAQYLELAGYKQKRAQPTLLYSRGAFWQTLAVGSPKKVRVDVSLTISPTASGSQVRFIYDVKLPPAPIWILTDKERAFWIAEIAELEQAITTGQLSRATSQTLAARAHRSTLIFFAAVYMFPLLICGVPTLLQGSGQEKLLLALIALLLFIVAMIHLAFIRQVGR